MITAGVDVGSVATKVILLADGKEVLAREVHPTGVSPDAAAAEVFERAVSAAGIHREKILRVVATGYGRRRASFGDKVITEISACAKGVLWHQQVGKALMAIDLGGQDTKAILIGGRGVEDFVMNDKCAAGTGRFLETIARALEVSLDDLGGLSLKAQNPVRINSTCTVFAESEVISLLSQGTKIEDIVAGIHGAIAERIAGMVCGFGPLERVVFCGGGARNIGVKVALEDRLGVEVIVPDQPQFVNATGAALFAQEELSS